MRGRAFHLIEGVSRDRGRLLLGVAVVGALLCACDPVSSSGSRGATECSDASCGPASDASDQMSLDAGGDSFTPPGDGSVAPPSEMDSAVPTDGGRDGTVDATEPRGDASDTDAELADAQLADAGDDGRPLPRSCDQPDTCLLGAVPAAGISDFAYDDTRNVLYLVVRPAAGMPGAVHRWDLTNGVFLDPLLTEGVYRGVDLSPSQHLLVVSDALTSSAGLGVHVVDLETEESQRIGVPNSNGDDGTYMATFADDDTLLMSASFPGSGFPPVRRVNLRTGVVGSLSLSGEWAMFARSADGSIVGIVEPSSLGYVGRYEVESGTLDIATTASLLTGDYRYPYDLCVSPDGEQITVLSSTTGAMVFDRDLSLLWSLGVRVGDLDGGRPFGCAYNPVSGELYLLWRNPPPEHAGIAAYDPATLRPVSILEPGFGSGARNNAFSAGRMRVSRDGTLLFIQGSASVAIYALGGGPSILPAPMSPSAVLPGRPAAPAYVPRAVVDAATAYQINVAHTGAQTGAALGMPLAQKWVVDLHAPLAYPVIADGLVFAAAGPWLYALDQIDGSLVWGPKLVGEGEGTASATYENGRVYAVSSSGMVAAFDASTGARAWTNEVGGFPAPPIAADGVVYVGGPAHIEAFEQDTGAVRWSRLFGGGGSTPALDGASLFVGQSCDEVHAFDAALGSLLWEGSGSCNGIGGAMAVAFQGRVYARDRDTHDVFDATNGTELGTLQTSQPPVFDSTGRMFLVTTVEPGIADELSAFDANEDEPAWTFRARTLSAPVTAGGHVYVVSKPSELYVLDAATGRPVDGTTLPASYAEPSPLEALAPASLAIGEGMLVVPAGSQLVAY